MVRVARGIWRVQLLGIALLGLVSCGHHPDWDRLEAQGNEIVRVVEVYRSAHGEYPPSLIAAGTQPPKTPWGEWTYHRSDKGFYLSVGDYGRDGFELYYSPDVGWTRSS